MHGYQHLYESKCKDDYLGHGGYTEFSGFSYEDQYKKYGGGNKHITHHPAAMTRPEFLADSTSLSHPYPSYKAGIYNQTS